MADSRQFGAGRNRQFGDKPTGGAPGDSSHCAECEAMLIDALDGTLSAADQAQFDRHAAGCEPCGQLVADARRGAAWLELLRTSAPEPSADLLERILAETSWPQVTGAAPAAFAYLPAGGTAMAPGYLPAAVNVIPFPRRAYSAVRRSGFGRIVLQPRLAMTAAMAFFSIALTMNITGIHPTSLRASDLAPSSLRRDFFSANARVVQYYEGLRVVYELESRVHELQSAQDTDVPSDNQVSPASEGQLPAQPATPTPTQPGATKPKADQPAGSQPGTRQPARGKSAANPHTSHREDMNQTRRMVVAETIYPASPGTPRQARLERKLV